MHKIIAVLSASLALSACGIVPTASDTAPESSRDDVSETGEIQTDSVESGLGAIVYNGDTRTQPCKKQRRTGSHLFRVGCADPDSGSQPVRYGTFNDLGHLAMSGSVRPEN
jgi:hypothetical protein